MGRVHNLRIQSHTPAKCLLIRPVSTGHYSFFYFYFGRIRLKKLNKNGGVQRQIILRLLGLYYKYVIAIILI